MIASVSTLVFECKVALHECSFIAKLMHACQGKPHNDLYLVYSIKLLLHFVCVHLAGCCHLVFLL